MGYSNMTKSRAFLENLILVAIVLVLVQTFLEDLAVVLQWSVEIRRILLFAGLAFDVLFTVEFVTRSYEASSRGAFSTYFWNQYGWVDLLASVPLLMLNSGPAALATLAGGLSFVGVGGTLNVLKVVKAIRVSRVLRLLRALKLFKNIKNTESPMAQRHVTLISTLTVALFVGTLLVLAGVDAVFDLNSLESEYQSRVIRAFRQVEDEGLALPGNEERLAALMDTVGSVLVVEHLGAVRYSRESQPYFNRYYRSTDYAMLERGPIIFFVDLKPMNRTQGATNLRYFVVIVVLVLGYVFWYSPRFALTVTDPLHVMHRGMAEGAYNLEVLLPRERSLREDDVYQLAAVYNRVFLPMKDRDRVSHGEENEGSQLTLDNVGDLFS